QGEGVPASVVHEAPQDSGFVASARSVLPDHRHQLARVRTISVEPDGKIEHGALVLAASLGKDGSVGGRCSDPTRYGEGGVDAEIEARTVAAVDVRIHAVEADGS